MQQHGLRVLLFPQAEWQPRTWPPAYWVDLAWLLHDSRVSAAIMLASRDERFFNVPLYFYGCALGDVAALISRVELVVGNDSFPAHLAGTLGTRTLALMGPTRAACVFGHIPEVVPLAADEPGCAGCHFSPPYRPACDQGCQALHLLTPATVFAHAAALLSQRASSVGR
jgi:ADP-heptose:LPS heptosyltransferase